MKLRLIQLRRIIREEVSDEASPDFNQFLPDEHMVGMKVPKGGSMCANCKWVSDDGKSCGNKHFQKWNANVKDAGDPSKLPFAADEYCCDLWQGG